MWDREGKAFEIDLCIQHSQHWPWMLMCASEHVSLIACGVQMDVVGIVISWTGAERAYIYMCETVRAVSASTTRSGFAWARLWLAYVCVMRVCPLRRAGGDDLTAEGQLASKSPHQVAPSSHADTPCGRASQSLLSAHSNDHGNSISERLSLWEPISELPLRLNIDQWYYLLKQSG